MIYIETPRLILRSWNEADIDPFILMNRDAEVMRYYPALLSDEETRRFVERICLEFTQKNYGLYAVELKSSSEFIGYVGLHEIGFNASFTPGVEIGWRLKSEHHRQGYAPEAARAVLKLAADAGLEELYSFTSVKNRPSERVMEKIGMSKKCYFNHPALPAEHPLSLHVLYHIALKH